MDILLLSSCRYYYQFIFLKIYFQSFNIFSVAITVHLVTISYRPRLFVLPAVLYYLVVQGCTLVCYHFPRCYHRI